MKFRTILFGSAAIFIAGASLYFILPAFMDWREQKATRERLEKRLKQQNRDINKLQRRIHALRTNPQAIERVAREKFGWCRPNEKIYHIEPSEETEPKASTENALRLRQSN